MSGDDGVPPTISYSTPHCLQTPPSANDGDLVVESFPMTYSGYTYAHSHIAYIKGRQPVPLVLVFPNYAGLKQFDIDQASFLAKVGYVGLAVDIYKDVPEYTYEDRNPSDPNVKELRDKHYKGSFDSMQSLLANPKYWRGLMGAYLEAAQQHPAVCPGLAAAVGYCFGGQCCLEQLRAGHQLQAVVSIHGLLQSLPYTDGFKRRLTNEEFRDKIDFAPNTHNKECKVLIENGEWDEYVPPSSIWAWKQEMDSQGIDWRFNTHARAHHNFALAPGVISNSYVEAADRRCTLSMLSFFMEVWPNFPQFPVLANACGTVLGQQLVSAAKT